MAEIKLNCFNCGSELIYAHPPGRREECPRCRSDVHACKNCQHYDRTSYNECRESQADVVIEKTRSNFCDHFVPGKGIGAVDQKAAMKAAAEALFKKKPQE